ncbi:MAG: UDP-glucose/GDP-mannose dehydrogenase family protein [Deltaproteobacteria bacterium]|nr:UDP-glucose/GDP-mannose dehydrogenase family protein [Deltaproteobacteria bacterium]
MRICVIGTGYVGLVAGAGFSDYGNHVRCVDVDADKIERLKRGELPIYEPGLAELIERSVADDRLAFSTDVAGAVAEAEVVFIAVGTPQGEDGSADLRSVLAVAETIGMAMRGYLVVAIKSTVPVGTNERVREVIGRHAKHQFSVVSNPEFLKEGDAVADFLSPDRVVVGVDDERAREILHRLYAPMQRKGERLIFMDPRSAEMTKYVANAFLATRISFINEMALLCERLGADIAHVRRGVGSDSRIGPRYLYPGCGYGGSCFPKDVSALRHMAEQSGKALEILGAVHRVNEAQKDVLFQRLDLHFAGDLAGKTIALWGIAFKPRTDDIREAPALRLIDSLLAAGARVRAYDPEANDAARALYGDRVTVCRKSYDVFEGADALVVATEWQEFRNPDFTRIREALRSPVIVDGRNVYAGFGLAAMGFAYYGIGVRE